MDFYTELNKSLDYRLDIKNPTTFTFSCLKKNKLPTLKIFTQKFILEIPPSIYVRSSIGTLGLCSAYVYY